MLSDIFICVNNFEITIFAKFSIGLLWLIFGKIQSLGPKYLPEILTYFPEILTKFLVPQHYPRGVDSHNDISYIYKKCD